MLALSVVGFFVSVALLISLVTCQIDFCATFCCCCYDARARRRRRSERQRSRRARDRTENEGADRSQALGTLSRLFNFDDFDDHAECTICLEDFTDEDRVTPLPCDERHYFHSHCIEDWFRRNDSCPLCKQTFSANKL